MHTRSCGKDPRVLRDRGRSLLFFAERGHEKLGGAESLRVPSIDVVRPRESETRIDKAPDSKRGHERLLPIRANPSFLLCDPLINFRSGICWFEIERRQHTFDRWPEHRVYVVFAIVARHFAFVMAGQSIACFL